MAVRAVRGGGGVTLHVEEDGPREGRPILFIHGFSQCGLAWTRQMRSDLVETFRLVAMDIRGHGRSDKPPDAYGDSRLWAQDVQAVISTLQLGAPVLVGWSYGGVIISDYLREYGDTQIAGVQLVAAVSRLGDPLLSANFLSSEFLALVPGFFSNDAAESVAALSSLLRLCVQQEPSPDDLFRFLGYNATVPPYVRQGLFARHVNNDAVLAGLHTPVSLVYGEADRILSPRACAHFTQLMPHATVSSYADTGHMPFWEARDRFNRELRAFVSTCDPAISSTGAAHRS